MNIEENKIYKPARCADGKPPTRVSGFASPAEDSAAERINLNSELIRNRQTYIYRTAGNAMIDIGIQPGAMIVFECRLEYFHGDIVVVRLGDELYVRELRIENGRKYLRSANENNPHYKPVEITEFLDFEICGTVTNSINSHQKS